MKNVTTSEGCLKCKGCCYFHDDHDAELAPFFTKDEAMRVSLEGLRPVTPELWQGKVVPSKNPSFKYACHFLNEERYRCGIYENRPIDCVTWPFIISIVDNRYYLCSANSDWCPAVDSRNIYEENLVLSVLDYLVRAGYFSEIRLGKRQAWPMEESYIIIREISEYIR